MGVMPCGQAALAMALRRHDGYARICAEALVWLGVEWKIYYLSTKHYKVLLKLDLIIPGDV